GQERRAGPGEPRGRGTGGGRAGEPREASAFDPQLHPRDLDGRGHHGAGGGAHVQGTVGVSGVYQVNDTRGPVPLVPDARARSAAAFVFEELALAGGRWTLLAGGRIDLRRLTADSNPALALGPERRDYTALSG